MPTHSYVQGQPNQLQNLTAKAANSNSNPPPSNGRTRLLNSTQTHIVKFVADVCRVQPKPAQVSSNSQSPIYLTFFQGGHRGQHHHGHLGHHGQCRGLRRLCHGCQQVASINSSNKQHGGTNGSGSSIGTSSLWEHSAKAHTCTDRAQAQHRETVAPAAAQQQQARGYEVVACCGCGPWV